MKTPNDLWEDLGSLSEEELSHVMTKLFSIYEARLNINPNEEESVNFFKNLAVSIAQTSECNLNRR